MAILVDEKRDVQVSNNFNTTGFKIQASAKAFEILSSNIYTHKVRAVIREISCNAYDAHVAAGNPEKPFDVHLPTHLEPWFGVRDYGIGLSDSDVREIFTTYFCSTKTNSNDFVGALGLGSKSPFCLVDSFVVKSYLNGFVTTYSCYKDENGEPQVASLTTENTEEPNGVYIHVAIQGKVAEFREEAVEVYQYFKQLPNINDKTITKDIESAKSGYDFIADDDSMAFTGDWGNAKAIMGNVAYNIPEEVANFGCSGYIRFNIGELSFNAGREELSLDNRTVETIKKRYEQVKATIEGVIKDKIEKYENEFERARYAYSMNKGGFSRLIGNGFFEQYALPSVPDDQPKIKFYGGRSWGRGVNCGDTRILQLGKRVRYFMDTPRMHKRITDWCKNNRDYTIVLLNPDHVKLFNIPSSFIEDMNNVFPKTVSNYTRSAVSKRTKVCIYQGGRTQDWADATVANDGTVKIYVTIDRYKPDMGFYRLDHIIKFLTSYDEKPVVYGLKPSYISSKEFDASEWINLNDYVKEVVDTLPDAYIYDYTCDVDSMIIHLFKGKTSDDNINTICKLDSEDNKKLVNYYQHLGYEDKIKHSNILNELAVQVEKDYPCIKLLDRWAGSDKINIIKQYIEEKQNEKRI